MSAEFCVTCIVQEALDRPCHFVTVTNIPEDEPLFSFVEHWVWMREHIFMPEG